VDREATEVSTTEMGASGNLICGRFVPGRSFGDTGYGLLWMTKSRDDFNSGIIIDSRLLVQDIQTHQGIVPLTEDELAHFPEMLESIGLVITTKDAGQALSEQIVVAYEIEDFMNVVRYLVVEAATGVRLSREISLLARLLRLAAKIVEAGDVVPFAAYTQAEWPQVQKAILQLSKIDDEGWTTWGFPSAMFRSVWCPAWQTSAYRALRMQYVALADSTFADSFTSDWPWMSADHGQSIVDLWMIFCVDVLMRQILAADCITELTVETKSTYRIGYRGEDDVLLAWCQGLTVNDRGQSTCFMADGWLVWRLLRQSLMGSGWQEKWLLNRSGVAYYHLEFELTTPSHAELPWRLEAFVVHNELDTRNALRDWWREPTRRWQVGNDVLIAPDLWILPSLHRAAKSCPTLVAALEKSAPCGCEIAVEDLLSFATDQMPHLVSNGFMVRTPAFDTAQAQDIRIRVQVKRGGKARAKAKNVGRSSGWFDANELLDFDWTVVIDNYELTQAEFESLVKSQAPYVQIDGSWKLVPIQDILKQMQTFPANVEASNQLSLSALQLTRVLLENDGDEIDIPLDVSFEDDAFDLEQVMHALTNAHEPTLIEVPVGFQGTLRHYQQTGFSWLLHLRKIGCGACLADDMGLGKTIQVLTYLLYLKENHLTTGPHLLVCPTSLLQNWKMETSRFAPDIGIYVHHGATRNGVGGEKTSPLQQALQSHDMILTTYATLVRDAEELSSITWDAVIADEAQNIKNIETKQSLALRGLQGTHRLALTGTPVENRLEELWSIFQFIQPGYLGSLSWFRKRFADPIAHHNSSPSAGRLQRLLRPLLLRRRKTEPSIQMELPEKWEMREYAALTGEQAAVYQSIVDKLFVGIDGTTGMSRRGQILTALVRLKQVCDHPCLVAGGSTDVKKSGKLKMVLSLIEDVVDEGEYALVFTQFRDMGEILCDTLQTHFGWRPQYLHGGLNANVRGKMVEDFQAGKASPVLVLSLKAGGVGLNLTRANHVFHYDRWWNPAVEDQATDRVFRIGQTKDVQVHKMVCSGTLEERIDAMITSKRALSAAVVGESEGFITELDNATLRDLFTLKTESGWGDDD